MMKVLVVYGTKTGCTEGVARTIASTLVASGAEVEVTAPVDDPDPAAYDAVIVGSGVRAGRWHGSVTTWITDHASILRSKPVAFYTACLTLVTDPEKTDEVRAYTEVLLSETGIEPVAYGLFAGMNEPTRFSLPERLILKALKAPQGDFRDEEAIAEWTLGIQGVLGVAS